MRVRIASYDTVSPTNSSIAWSAMVGGKRTRQLPRHQIALARNQIAPCLFNGEQTTTSSEKRRATTVLLLPGGQGDLTALETSCTP